MKLSSHFGSFNAVSSRAHCRQRTARAILSDPDTEKIPTENQRLSRFDHVFCCCCFSGVFVVFWCELVCPWLCSCFGLNVCQSCVVILLENLHQVATSARTFEFAVCDLRTRCVAGRPPVVIVQQEQPRAAVSQAAPSHRIPLLRGDSRVRGQPISLAVPGVSRSQWYPPFIPNFGCSFKPS